MYTSDEKLKALLELTNAINDNKGVDYLLEYYTYMLTEIVGIQKYVLLQCLPKWKLINAHKIKTNTLEFDYEDAFSHIKEKTFIDQENDGPLSQFNVVLPVHHKKTPIAFLMLYYGETNVDLEYVKTVTNFIAVAVENKRLVAKTVAQEIAKRDLGLAAAIQGYLVPNKFELNDFIQVHAVYMPHNKIGGDYYDFIPSGNDYYFCMADVSGKGMSAALLMANFQAQLRTLIQYTGLPLDDVILELNKRVNISVKGEKFITIFLAKYDTVAKKLTYINAGHNPPVMVHKAESKLLGKGSIGLGMMQNLPFLEIVELDIKPGTIVTCYTDGIIEQLNAKNEEFGLHQVEKIVLKNTANHASIINGRIIKAVEEHRENKSYNDDISLFTCRFI